MKADVGGSTAGYIDLASRISEKLPLQILVVIALSFVLLILAFRTVVIPAQAAVMNLLSIGASYGVLTAVFQYGWLSRRDRPGRTGADRLLRAAVHVRGAVRTVDGLRGVPRQPDRGARARGRGQPQLGRLRAGHERARDHRGGADHGVRVRQLRAQRRSDDQAVRRRPRGRGDPRRDRRALPARAGADAADGQGQLVDAEVAGPDRAAREHRGRGVLSRRASCAALARLRTAAPPRPERRRGAGKRRLRARSACR